jgi:DeoR/GlpR family transcriptional regulator of sugar metabolism
MANPKVTYPQNTTFGNRLQDLKDDKVRVAQEVVKTFMGTGVSAFVGDGSSTFYVGLELFDRGTQATIWTNHLAIAHEFPLWATSQPGLTRTTVLLAGGQVDPDLMMTCGVDTDQSVQTWASKAQNIILSLRSIFAEQGPAGFEQLSLSVKQTAAMAAMPSGRRIIFVADYKKLSCQYAVATPLVYPSPKDWDSVMRQPNAYIVTTRHPDAKGLREHIPNPRTELDWYRHHSRQLSLIMKDRFIEI